MSLELIRNKHAWFTRGVLILLAVIMVLGLGFMSDDFGSMMSTPTQGAAEVNGDEVTLVDYYVMRDSIRKQMNPQGEELPQEYENQISVIALNQLINTKLLAQKAADLGFKVTNEELDESIRTNPAFQIDGKFVGRDMYTNFIEQSRNQEIGEFEKMYREELLAEKMLKLIESTAVVTDEKLFSTYKMENEKVNLYYIQLSVNDFKDSQSLSDEEVKKYYETRKGEFMAPESRKLRYVVLSPETFEANVKVTEDEVASYYNAYSSEFVREDGSEKPLEEAKADIEAKLKAERGEAARQELLGTLQSRPDEPGSVDSIAAEYSAGPVLESGALILGESLPDIPPVIIRQAFDIQAGKSAIVPVGASIWAVEVAEVTPAREKTFEEAKAEAALALKRQNSVTVARKKGNEIIGKLSAAGRKNLASEAKKLGLELKETGYFSRTGNVPGIGSPELRADAFTLDPAAAVSGKLYASGDTFYIVSFKDKQSASAEEFQLKKQEIMTQELQNQQAEIVRNWIQDLRREAEIKPNAQLFPSQG